MTMMGMKRIWVLLLVTLCLCVSGIEGQRKGHVMFGELACNRRLASAYKKNRVRWSEWPRNVKRFRTKLGVVHRIPCGRAVKVSNPTTAELIVNGILHVEGYLKFVDAARDVVVRSKGVVVEGRLDAEFSEGSLTFELSGSTSVKLEQLKGHRNRRRRKGDLGKKVFAVVGGTLDLEGFNTTCNTWTHLSQDALAGSNELNVESLGGCVKSGDSIAIASSDFYNEDGEPHTEERTVVGVTDNTLELDRPLEHRHIGHIFQVDGVTKNNGMVDQRAEVALLSRRIRIKGLQDGDDPLIGGHLIVFHTARTQNLVGIELVNMGQQGSMGRYPIHFHMCMQVDDSLVSHCSIRDSNQRGVVIHGTHGVTVEWTTAFRVAGHTFMLEDGIEQNNVFLHNIGLVSTPVESDRLLVSGTFVNTDDVPSTFWITNPINTFQGNVAVESSDSGFWFELDEIRGSSQSLPGAMVPNPDFGFEEDAPKMVLLDPSNLELQLFKDNTAHSNFLNGFSTYPNGYTPLSGKAVFEGVRVYKNAVGIMTHVGIGLTFEKAIISDNVFGIDLDEALVSVRDSVIVGETVENGVVRNSIPLDFDRGDGSFMKGYYISGCTPGKVLPLIGIRLFENPIEPENEYQDRSSVLSDLEFAGFNSSSCRPAAAFSFSYDRPMGLIRANDGVIGNVTVADETQLFWFDRTWITHPEKYSPILGSSRTNAVISLGQESVGNRFAVTDNAGLVDDSKCEYKEAWGGYLCDNVCYRSMVFEIAIEYGNVEDFRNASLELSWTDSTGASKVLSVNPLVQGEFEDDDDEEEEEGDDESDDDDSDSDNDDDESDDNDSERDNDYSSSQEDEYSSGDYSSDDYSSDDYSSDEDEDDGFEEPFGKVTSIIFATNLLDIDTPYKIRVLNVPGAENLKAYQYGKAECGSQRLQFELSSEFKLTPKPFTRDASCARSNGHTHHVECDTDNATRTTLTFDPYVTPFNYTCPGSEEFCQRLDENVCESTLDGACAWYPEYGCVKFHEYDRCYDHTPRQCRRDRLCTWSRRERECVPRPEIIEEGEEEEDYQDCFAAVFDVDNSTNGCTVPTPDCT